MKASSLQLVYSIQGREYLEMRLESSRGVDQERPYKPHLGLDPKGNGKPLIIHVFVCFHLFVCFFTVLLKNN